jgi:hypothetical protein
MGIPDQAHIALVPATAQPRNLLVGLHPWEPPIVLRPCSKTLSLSSYNSDQVRLEDACRVLEDLSSLSEDALRFKNGWVFRSSSKERQTKWDLAAKEWKKRINEYRDSRKAMRAQLDGVVEVL